VLLADGGIADLGNVVSDISGDTLSPAKLDELRRLDHAKLPRLPAGGRLGPCVAGVGKFIAIGLNYADHAAETGAKIPSEPIVIMKATSCIVDPNDTVLKPRGSTKIDW
jgi:5-carboxymethyl-2-hydroxymuconate isomerase